MDKPTAEEVDAHVAACSTGLGCSFKIYCRYCYDAGVISTTVQKYRNANQKLKAAEKFANAGWKLYNGVAVCPTCVPKHC